MKLAIKLREQAALVRRNLVYLSIEIAARDGNDSVVIEKNRVDKNTFDELVHDGLEVETYKSSMSDGYPMWKISWGES